MRQLLFLFLLFPALPALTQNIALSDAVSIALERNYDVQIAAYSYEIEANNAAWGNAGLLPSVFLAANGSYSSEDTEVTFASPEQPAISQDGASTIAYGASANLAYQLFSGGRRMHVLKSLQSLSEDARLRERLAMENTAFAVSGRFLEALRRQEEVRILTETVELSQNRLNRSQEGYSYGSSTKLDVLNAEVDLRRDSIDLAQANLELQQSLRDLYFAMGVPADTSMALSDEYEFAELLDRQALAERALQSNTTYLRTRNSVFTAEENLKSAKSDIWPTLAANAAYQYSYTDFEANFLDTQENLGWNAGLTFRFNIFDGNRVNRAIENAELNREIAQVEVERAENEILRLVNNAYDTYLTNLELLAMSERNLDLAETNYERSRDAFATGQITGIELRNAQLNLSDARTAIVRQRIITKIAEIGLLYEAGILLE